MAEFIPCFLYQKIKNLCRVINNCTDFLPYISIKMLVPVSYTHLAIDGALDVHNFLGRFAIWVLIALCISIYSNSAIRASVNVFAFFVGMVASYYLYSNYIAGFFPRSYAMIWFGFTAVSPLLAFVCWYARGKSKLAFILSALILAVLFNMCFVYGFGYFSARSVLEVIVFIIGFIVLKRNSLRSSALMGTISIVLAFLLNIIIPFHFG